MAGAKAERAIVVDSRPSMLEPALDGMTKLDVARSYVVDELLNTIVNSRKSDIMPVYFGTKQLWGPHPINSLGVSKVSSALAPAKCTGQLDIPELLSAIIREPAVKAASEIVLISSTLKAPVSSLDAQIEDAAQLGLRTRIIMLEPLTEKHYLGEFEQFTPSGQTKVPPYYKKVKPVSSYSGYLTLGDPTKPLLSLDIDCLPLTRKAASPLEKLLDAQTEEVVVGGLQYTSRDSESGSSTKGHQTKGNQGEAAVDTERMAKGFSYGSQIVPVSKDLMSLMTGEFEGAQSRPKAFEIAAFIPRVAPWLPLGYSDYIKGRNAASRQGIAALAYAAHEQHCDVLARMVRAPRGKSRGNIELCVLQPTVIDGGATFVRSALPWRDDYQFDYAFGPAKTPSPELATIAEQLVTNMSSKEPQLDLMWNPRVQRTVTFIKSALVSGGSDSAEIAPYHDRSLLDLDGSNVVADLAEQLHSRAGVTKRETHQPAKRESTTYVASESLIDLDDVF